VLYSSRYIVRKNTHFLENGKKNLLILPKGLQKNEMKKDGDAPKDYVYYG
jgi:hypothetical protein